MNNIYIFIILSDYPEELHDHHSDYPLAPERVSVKPTDLSTYQVELLKSLYGDDFQPSDSHEKLIPNLRSKEKYILHYRNLKLYLSLGMKLTKIHRALSFDQTPWLKSYIDFNTVQRTAARNYFEKDFF